MLASDLMTPDPATVTPKTSVAEVWDVMREADIRHVPVVEDGCLVGMLSDRDLGRLDLVRVLNVEGVDALQQALATPVLSIMQPDVIFVEPDAEAVEVIELLLDHKIGALPVVESGTRNVIGIISYVDVLRALQSRLEED